jgi:predicted enzyme related to lactoylglutathione lyase
MDAIDPNGPSPIGVPMKRVTGIGGIFFKAKNAPAMHEWYRKHLGIDVQPWGGAAFLWADEGGKPQTGTTIWSVSPQDNSQFLPGKSTFMVNYRVADVDALHQVLKEEGCRVSEKVEESEFGKFAWVLDPEENKVELWQPPVGQ